jgi:hypothetical protein
MPATIYTGVPVAPEIQAHKELVEMDRAAQMLSKIFQAYIAMLTPLVDFL